MQVPTRKHDKIPRPKSDPFITLKKYNELKAKLERLLTVTRPPAIEEVKRLALMGDFSENAAYQIAKGRLRGLNQRILEIEDMLRRADIIVPQKDSQTVELGSIVTIETDGKEKTYQILGSAETNPAVGIISHNSPIGAALLGKRLGETADIRLASKIVKYRIIRIG